MKLNICDYRVTLFQDNGRVGDKFMNMMQESVARIPYMTAVGNHESA